VPWNPTAMARIAAGKGIRVEQATFEGVVMYIKDLENFDYTPGQCRTVMRDNGVELYVRQPA
jgi:hypothetical protein